MSTLELTIEDLISKYSVGLDQPIARPQALNGRSKDGATEVILVTGTTGSLGAEILLKLLADKTMKKIYAYNRPSQDGSSLLLRHQRRFEDKGFEVEPLRDARLVHLEAEVSRGKLGLQDKVYKELLQTVTIIIHCAWASDVYSPLSEFEGLIAGMRNLIQLARDSAHSPKFLSISSLLCAQSWDPLVRSFPENEIVDPSTAEGSGYGESKYVADTLLARSGIRGISLRCDQICGSEPRGAWNIFHWIPILLMTSLTLESLPVIPGLSLSWVPADTVANTVLDVMRCRDELPQSINVTHPRPIAWDDLAAYMVEALVEEGKPSLALVPWDEWMEELVLNQRLGITKGLPALHIMEFYGVLSTLFSRWNNIAWYECGLSQRYSPSLRDAPKLARNDVRLWVNYWVKHGL